MRTSNLTITVLLILTLIVFTLPSYAGTRACNSTMVTANICRSLNDVVYTLAISTVDPDTTGPRFAPSQLVLESFSTLFNWQSPTSCTTDMVGAGICNSGQLGTLVAITKTQFADLQIRLYIMQTIAKYQSYIKHQEAQAVVDAEPIPDVGN